MNGVEHMPRRGTKLRDSYMGRYHLKPGVLVPGLTACRLAAGLSERGLAELVDSNQTTINDLEAQSWVKADYRLLRRLCRVLKVRPADLMSSRVVEDTEARRRRRAESALGIERDERRRQVNRLKRKGWHGPGAGSVLLRGLKARRLEAGLTQRELARLIGTNQTTIAQLEKKYASRGAYMKTIQKLCLTLEVQPVDLITRDYYPDE